MAFKPSAAQLAFFDFVKNSSGNCILEAVAGAGKTTTILEGINLMRGRVWFGVYNKKMADEILEKVAARKDLASRVETWDKVTRTFSRSPEPLVTSTFHSLGFSLINSSRAKGTGRAEVDEKKVSRIVEEMIAAKEATAQQRLDHLHDMAAGVVSLVSMAKNRGFVQVQKAGPNASQLTDMSNDQNWFDMAEKYDLFGNVPEGSEAEAIRFARAALMRSNTNTDVVDMDDMVYLPLALNLRVAPWNMFDWVLVDEAQDTNPTRRALARMVRKHDARFVAVGDPHQAIYGFTGADNDSLQQIADTFNAIKLPLTVTYRCPKAVVRHAQKWVSHIQSHESSPEGEVREMAYHDVLATMTSIPRDEYSETAFLCRNNKYLVGLCFKMIRAGMPAKIEGREIGTGLIQLATRWKACKTVNGLETKLQEYLTKEVAKATAAGHTDKADRITDQVETLLVMIDRAREQKLDRVSDLEAMIQEMFQDNVAGKGLITLCSAHKSKGLEWDTVYLLGRDQLMPSKFAVQQWQLDQENNLIYVAVTRAKKTLIEVTGVREQKEGKQ